jgi:co-chaperonin GroES (HSP10)
MKTGDELARGQRGATFQVEGGDEVLHDLKTLPKSEFLEKYEVTTEGYAEMVTALRAGADFKVVPEMRVKVSETPRPIANDDGKVSQSKATVTTPQKPEYSGVAKGDNVLVIRTEQEHSAQLIIPPSAKAKSDIGRVVSAGPEASRAKPGELIVFDRFAAHGKEIELVDEQGIPRQHLLLNDADVLVGLTRHIKPESTN